MCIYVYIYIYIYIYIYSWQCPLNDGTTQRCESPTPITLLTFSKTNLMHSAETCWRAGQRNVCMFRVPQPPQEKQSYLRDAAWQDPPARPLQNE